MLATLLAFLPALPGTARAALPAPLEAASPFCEGGASLYQRGMVLFCAAPETRRPDPITYSVTGDRADQYRAAIDDAVRLGACLSGVRFQKAEHGALVFDIAFYRPRAGGREPTPSSYVTSSNATGQGAARVGRTSMLVDRASRQAVGAALQDGVRAFLGMAVPADGAFARRVRAAMLAGHASLTSFPHGGTYCDVEHTLVARGGVPFCAPEAPAWPKTTGYALLGDAHAYDGAIVAAAAFAGDLAGSTMSVSRDPSLVVLLASTDVDASSFSELARRAGVKIPSPILDYYTSFDIARNTNKDQWAGDHGSRVGDAVISVRDREPAAITDTIRSVFLSEFGIERAH